MEDFPAISKDAVGGSAQMLSTCDVFVGIYARRYGTLGSAGLSVTESEYDAAKEMNIPRLCFLLRDGSPWPDEWVEGEPGAGKLAAFRRKIEGDQIVKFFGNLEELRKGIQKSAETFLAKEEKRRKLRIRALQSTAAIAVLAGFGWLSYMQTDLYQIQRVVSSAPFEVVDEANDRESIDSAQEYLKSLVAAGRTDDALKTARQIGNGRRRSRALNSIAVALAINGQAVTAKLIWAEAHTAARSIEVEADHSAVLIEIARSEAQGGNYADALATAKLIESSYYHSEAINAIAMAQIAARRFPDALRSVALLKEDKADPSWVLRLMVQEEVNAGQLKEAIGTADQIRDPKYLSPALREIAVEQAKLGEYSTAAANITRIVDATDRAAALRVLAEAETRGGRVSEALKLARTPKLRDRFRVLSAIAMVQKELGNMSGALDTWMEARAAARETGNFYVQCAALSAIATDEFNSGSRGQADQTWAEATQRVLEEPAPDVAEGNGIDANRVAYEKQVFLNNRSGALAEIARSLTGVGLIQEAKTVIERLDRLSDRSVEYGRVVEALAKDGEFQSAHEMLKKVDPEYFSEYLRATAIAEATRGRFAEAKHSAEGVQDGTGMPKRSPTFRVIAESEARAGKFGQARSTSKLCTPMDELSAFSTILKEYSVRRALASKR